MEPFKNVFSPELVGVIADHLQRRLPTFHRHNFEGRILASLADLELKDRAQLIADHIHQALPEDNKRRGDILLSMLHADENVRNTVQSGDDGVCGWGIQPLVTVVGQHGLGDFDRSLFLLKEMTKRFTSEFGIRYFLLADQDRVLATLTGWVDDKNHHVRRLVSEGTRPRLPWAMQLPNLIADPSPMLPILEALRDDNEDYVRRSVANHLNDIAKDHPDLVAGLANQWMKNGDSNRQKLVRHACRSLIKSGHRDALKAFGLSAPKIQSPSLVIDTPTVVFGQMLSFHAAIQSSSDKAQPLVVDYVVHFRKAKGELAGKVFKWTKFNLGPGETRELTRNHSIKPITTRKYYPGGQALSLRVNGEDFGNAAFELLMPGIENTNV